MLNDATYFKQIYIVCYYTDLRFGLDSLASIIESKTGSCPYVPDTLYLFCGRKTDRIFQWKGVDIIAVGEICQDYMHLLLSIPTKMRVSGFMGYLKGKSSLMITTVN